MWLSQSRLARDLRWVVPAALLYALAVVAATAWIFLSPYFAPWAQPTHWPWYAAMGTLNSLFWIGVALYAWRMNVSPSDAPAPQKAGRLLLAFAALLFVDMTGAALVQPIVNSPASAIRASLIEPGLETNALAAFVILAAATVAAGSIAWMLSRRDVPFSGIAKFAFLSPMVYLPLYFLTFTLTKESTTAFELLLKSLGL